MALLYPLPVSGESRVAQGTAGTDPWPVDITGGTVVITPSGTQDVNLKQVNGQTVNVGTGVAGTGTQRVAVSSDSSITVSATNLDIRDLVFATDKVDVSGSTLDVTISEFPAASAASDNFANPTTTNVMAMGMVFDGSTWDRARGDSTDGTLVNLGTNNDVTVSASSGTLANGSQTTVAAVAVEILAANANRKLAIIQNVGSANIRVGVTGVTTTTGMRLVGSGSIIFEQPFCPTNAIFAIREGAVSSTVFTQEVT